MGNQSSSSSKLKIDVSSAINLITSNIMNCSSNSIQIQELIVSGNNNIIDGRQVQALTLSAECSQNAQNMADLQQQIAQEISNTAKAQGASILSILGNSSSEVDTNIINDVRQNITQKTITNIVNQANTEQRAIISGDNNIVKFDQNQTANLVYKSAQNVINSLKSVQAINNAVAASTESKSSNDMFMWIIIIVVIAALVLLGPSILKWISGNRDNVKTDAYQLYMKSPNPPYSPELQMPMNPPMNQMPMNPPMNQMPMNPPMNPPINQMPMNSPILA